VEAKLSLIVRRVAQVVMAIALLLLTTAVGASAKPSSFPRYDHVFLMMEENEPYANIIGNPHAPILNALAKDYGLATDYHGTSDPSEPNYVAILGGNDFGISSDDPFYFPGQSVNAPNVMSELDSAGDSWKAYLQGMPYDGYRGYCFPAKCNGIPDADTQYVAKHNGIVNFADMHTPAEFAKEQPYGHLADDLASGQVPNFSYIVPDECDDMHGAPPWCVDSDNPGTVGDNWLVATGDKFVGQTVDAITSAPVWKKGHNAIVITWDEGNAATDKIVAIVITNHGPRGLTDPTDYNHYSLTASLLDAFGLSCLQHSCSASPMTPLFSTQGPATTPSLPAPFQPPANKTPQPPRHKVLGPKVTVGGSGWKVVPSPSLTNVDNVLASVSAASPRDAWAVGTYYPNEKDAAVLQTLGEHWNGSRWTAYPLPNVGFNENSLLGVSELRSGQAWAVGYFINEAYAQRALVERYSGHAWHVVRIPEPGAEGNILYGVAAISNRDVWGVGGQRDVNGVWHPLVEHWNGTTWRIGHFPTTTNAGSELLYAVSAATGSDVYAVGQDGTGFPERIVIGHFHAHGWSLVRSPADASESLDPLGLDATHGAVTIVGQREPDTVPNRTLVAAGPSSGVGLRTTPSQGAGENDLFSVTTASDGSKWADGWYIDPKTGNHEPIIEQGLGVKWSIVPTPDLNADQGDNGLAGIAAIPGGGLWAVGLRTNEQGNPATLIEYRK
jgi:hypothetical protein